MKESEKKKIKKESTRILEILILKSILKEP